MNAMIRKVANGFIVNPEMPDEPRRHESTPLNCTCVFETFDNLVKYLAVLFKDAEKEEKDV